MSAFIIQDETMNRVVSRITFTTWEQKSHIGNDLFRMNAAAVAARYRETPEDQPAFTATPDTYTDAECLKAVDCLVYQCSEGDVPASPQFAQLAELRESLAKVVNRDTAEYNCAAWD